MDPNGEPDDARDDLHVGGHRPEDPWMPTWLTKWIEKWPWMPTAVGALILLLLYILFRRGNRSR
jgi:hypothetical protein